MVARFAVKREMAVPLSPLLPKKVDDQPSGTDVFRAGGSQK
jgi:hypothetical protein